MKLSAKKYREKPYEMKSRTDLLQSVLGFSNPGDGCATLHQLVNCQ